MSQSSLLDLAARVEAATGPDRELDSMICDRAFPLGISEMGLPAYTASLDAAMTLVPETAGFSVQHMGHPCLAFVHLPGHPEVSSDAESPALALTAASLRARAAIHDDKGK